MRQAQSRLTAGSPSAPSRRREGRGKEGRLIPLNMQQIPSPGPFDQLSTGLCRGPAGQREEASWIPEQVRNDCFGPMTASVR